MYFSIENKEKPYKVGVGFFKVGVHLDNVIDVNSVSDTDLCDCGFKKSLWVKVSKMKNCMQLLLLMSLTDSQDMTPWCILHGGWLALSASLLIPMNKAVRCQVMIS